MSASNAGDLGSIPGSGRSLEKEVATHSSILAWRIPWMEDPGAKVHGVANAGSYVSSTPSVLRNRIFHSGCISLLSYQ